MVNVRLFTEMAVAVSLAAVLDLFKIPLPHLLYGGSVSLESLPIFIVAFRRGGKAGLMVGGVYGFVNFIIRPVVVHPLQIGLDYPLAFGLLGGGGGWIGYLITGADNRVSMGARLRVFAGILAGNGLRFLAHFISGMVFFAAYAPKSQPVWLYSMTYNASYIIPQMVIHILLLQFILRILTLKMR